MRIAIAGGGPVGVFTALCLARRGHAVTVVDRDPGPPPEGVWQRAGVMQFRHPHGFRAQVRWALQEELPDVYDALLAAGAEVRLMPGAPEQMAGLYCRRSVFERTLRAAAHRERLQWKTGHVDDVVLEGESATGLRVDGAVVEADLVIVATGRNGRLGEERRGSVEGGACGFSYVSRMYRARAGQAGCDLPGPSVQIGPGYYSLVMPQDAGTHSLLISHPSHAPEFAQLRSAAAFDHAADAVPNLAPWHDPDRFEPITDVLVGGNLTNTYRFQGPAIGMPPARGLLFVGDAVTTLNPFGARSLVLQFGQVRHLLGVLDDPESDLVDASLALDSWAEQHVRPWFLDHVHTDHAMLQAFGGGALDPSDRIPSDVICAAAAVDPSIGPLAGMYFGMVAGPDVLDPARRRVQDLLASGWRPPRIGPTAADLTTLVAA